MNKHAVRFLSASTILLTGMHSFNKYIENNLPSIPSSSEEKTFLWKNFNITYAEKGSDENPPLLLLHNLSPSSSKEEWMRIDQSLAKHFHVYELDLLGCGKSDKPNETYVNYMFVQLLSDFIKEIIGRKTNICASGFSCSFTLMTARFYPDIIDKLILISPVSTEDMLKPNTKKSKLQKSLIDLPLLGTFLYNCKMCKSAITDDYKYIYYYSDKNVSIKSVDTSYYNAHYKNSAGKFLYRSIIGNDTNINLIHALPKIENSIYIIGNNSYKKIVEDYKKYNKNIHAVYVSNCRMLPQLEIPETIIEKINTILHQN